MQGVKTRLENLRGLLTPFRSEYNQLSRQFWVTKGQVKTNKYDLSASRYRQVELDEIFYEKPQVTLDRLAQLEQVLTNEIQELGNFLK